MILLEFLKQINWLDIFLVILLIRICYISTRNGLPDQLFWFLGTIGAIYISLHYYVGFADFIGKRFLLTEIPIEYRQTISFVLLALAGYVLFVLLQKIFSRFIKMEATPRLNKYGGIVLGVIRGFLVSGLIFFIFLMSTVVYLQHSVHTSYAGRHLSRIAPATYSWLWNNLMSKFMPSEKFNSAVLKIK